MVRDAEIEVFRDRETRNQAERLVNEMKMSVPVLSELDVAAIERIGAREDFDERRFAGPVVTEQSNDLSPPDGKGNAIEDLVRAEALRNAPNVQQDVLHFKYAPICLERRADPAQTDPLLRVGP